MHNPQLVRVSWTDRSIYTEEQKSKSFCCRYEDHNRESKKTPNSRLLRDQTMTMLLVMYVCSGALLCAISIPLVLRKIGPNPLYGFRVRQTLEDPRVWFDVNAYAAKGLFCVGLINVITSLVFWEIPSLGVAGYALSCVAVFAVALTVNVVLSFRYLGRITRAKS
jgi:hypothetical protein